MVRMSQQKLRAGPRIVADLSGQAPSGELVIVKVKNRAGAGVTRNQIITGLSDATIAGEVRGAGSALSALFVGQVLDASSLVIRYIY